MAAKREQWRAVVYLDGLRERVNELPAPATNAGVAAAFTQVCLTKL